MTSLIATLAIASTPVVIKPEELAVSVLAEYKRLNAWQPSTPLRKPGSKKILAVYDPRDASWHEIVQSKTGLDPNRIGNRFEVGQCTWFAQLCRPDFRPDPRGGGRNDARFWLDQAKATSQAVGEFIPGEPPPLPQRGAIVVHKAWPGNPFGHVSIISEVSASGEITVFDANFASPLDGKVRERVISADDYLAGYIYPPSPSGDSTGCVLLKGPVKQFGTARSTEKSSGPYWYAVVRLGMEVRNESEVSVQIMPNLESAQEYDVMIYPRQFASVRVPKNDSRSVGRVAVGELPDRYAVILIRPTRLRPEDQPLEAPFVYLNF